MTERLAAAGSAVLTGGTLYTNASNSNTLDSISGGTFAFTNANAGTGKTVTASGVTVNDGNQWRQLHRQLRQQHQQHDQ